MYWILFSDSIHVNLSNSLLCLVCKNVARFSPIHLLGNSFKCIIAFAIRLTVLFDRMWFVFLHTYDVLWFPNTFSLCLLVHFFCIFLFFWCFCFCFYFFFSIVSVDVLTIWSRYTPSKSTLVGNHWKPSL